MVEYHPAPHVGYPVISPSNSEGSAVHRLLIFNSIHRQIQGTRVVNTLNAADMSVATIAAENMLVHSYWPPFTNIVKDHEYSTF